MARPIKCGICSKRRQSGPGCHAAGWVGLGSKIKVMVAAVNQPVCGKCREAVLDAAKQAIAEKMNEIKGKRNANKND